MSGCAAAYHAAPVYAGAFVVAVWFLADAIRDRGR